MQLVALNDEGQPISASGGQKGVSYHCPECRTELRLRSGIFRRPHFYHTATDRACRLGGKTKEHIEVQRRLKSECPELILERPFPEIGRIADAAWEKEKIIFEVQVSPISKEEVRGRIEDYQKAGYSVVWILHEKNFNKRRLSEAEIYLQGSCHYFTQMDSRGRGFIFDEWSRVFGGWRHRRGRQFKVNLCRPKMMLEVQVPDLPGRRGEWELYFEGDLVDKALGGFEVLEFESLGLRVVGSVRRGYLMLLDYLVWKLVG